MSDVRRRLARAGARAGSGSCCRRSDGRPARAPPAGRRPTTRSPGSSCRWSRSSPRRSTLPDPAQLGDDRSCRLLRDALRLGFRSSAGPFRSFGQHRVEPRPYQLVPLLMALKLDPVRLLIADDVGHRQDDRGGLIARELLDRGEVERLAVLCPPHLAEQWQARAARQVPPRRRAGPALDGRRGWSAACRSASRSSSATRTSSSRPTSSSPTAAATTSCATCPELVIVDEAHTCALGRRGRGARAPAPSAGHGAGRRPEPPPDPGHRHAAQRQGGRLPLPAGAARPRASPACPRT